MAEVPGPGVRVCEHCEHAAFGNSGTYCTLFNEEIWRETVAEECGEYTPVPWAASAAKGD